ncbi:MAG: hypothetical protein AVDCRST_MAG96-613 [uncultured Segetibacter sp.]|uniref:Uncharacterized protein n=1 Tax=uncultured Segetibacter sp. TaxID=481133 RepID=A0A6J4RJL9_9BACT|nr:MAG: hypothetical protein AVDCRST_MAG96-613 [uncultured Segetibacter sp.]
METHKGIPTFYAKSQQAWRAWLKKNHAKEQSVLAYHLPQEK